MKLSQIWQEDRPTKILALALAIVLWIVILGKRDFVFTKTVEINLVVDSSIAVSAQSADRVRIRVSGPRLAIKKFMEDPQTKSISVDLSGRDAGVYDIDVPLLAMEIPAGIKVLGVKPNLIRVELERKQESH